MRLLYVCSDFGIKPSGTKGASIHLRAITQALSEAGHSVSLLSPQPGPDAPHPAQRVLSPGCPPVDGCGKQLKRWMSSRGLGDGVAKELRPLLYNAWAQAPALAALQNNRPDVVIERLSLMGHVGLDLAEAMSLPFVVEVNALLTEEAAQFRSLELATLARTIEQRVLEAADAILPVSDALAEKIASRGIAKNKIHVVPNGANVQLFDSAPDRQSCRASLGIDTEFVVGFCGSLKVWHGVDVLLEAFARLLDRDSNAKLLIVGTGPQEVPMREAARRLKIDQSVIFTGAVPHADVPALLKAMDAAVAPFKQMDGFYFSPIKLFEYMAAGSCVVASRLGQIKQIIDDGRTGLLSEPGNPDDLFAKLDQVRTQRNLCRNMALAALQDVRDRHTWTATATRTLRIVSEVMENTHDGLRARPWVAQQPAEVLS